MVFATTTQLAIDVAMLHDRLNSWIESQSARVSKNSRGVLITQDDLTPLVRISEMLKELSENVADVEHSVSQGVYENCFLKGRLEHVNSLLRMCFDDYKANGRSDATAFLTIELNKHA